jgi:hypothetical protein
MLMDTVLSFKNLVSENNLGGVKKQLLHKWPLGYGPLCRLQPPNVTVIFERRLSIIA